MIKIPFKSITIHIRGNFNCVKKLKVISNNCSEVYTQIKRNLCLSLHSSVLRMFWNFRVLVFIKELQRDEIKKTKSKIQWKIFTKPGKGNEKYIITIYYTSVVFAC